MPFPEITNVDQLEAWIDVSCAQNTTPGEIKKSYFEIMSTVVEKCQQVSKDTIYVKPMHGEIVTKADDAVDPNETQTYSIFCLVFSPDTIIQHRIMFVLSHEEKITDVVYMAPDAPVEITKVH